MERAHTALVAPSIYKGVSWNEKAKKWKVQIHSDGVRSYLGLFDADDEKAAALKYDEAAEALGRPLNFPKAGEPSAFQGDKVKELSGFKGVSWDPGSEKWKAQIKQNGKHAYLGSFDNEQEAAHKYDETSATLGRPLNFPKASDGALVGPSLYKGVSWDRGKKKWRAQLKQGGKKSSLGYFDNEEAAARKYDEAAGIIGRSLNFPKADSDRGSWSGGASRFKGVSWTAGTKKWRANIQKDGKKTHLGCFDNEEEAARKYDEAATALGRPLNFDARTGEFQGSCPKKPRSTTKVHHPLVVEPAPNIARVNLASYVPAIPQDTNKRQKLASIVTPYQV